MMRPIQTRRLRTRSIAACRLSQIDRHHSPLCRNWMTITLTTGVHNYTCEKIFKSVASGKTPETLTYTTGGRNHIFRAIIM